MVGSGKVHIARDPSNRTAPPSATTTSNTMQSILRDSTFGQIIRFGSGNRIFRYKEEQAGYRIPDRYGLAPSVTPRSSSPTRVPTEKVERVSESPVYKKSTPVSDSECSTVVEQGRTGRCDRGKGWETARFAAGNVGRTSNARGAA